MADAEERIRRLTEHIEVQAERKIAEAVSRAKEEGRYETARQLSGARVKELTEEVAQACSVWVTCR